MYIADNVQIDNYPIKGKFPQIADRSMKLLKAEIRDEEVQNAMFEMRPSKAPGVDGLNAPFFQSQWEDQCVTLLGRLLSPRNWKKN